MLTVCSSDGYLTFVRFEAGALGILWANLLFIHCICTDTCLLPFI
jgi:hypothetical protein